MVDVSFLLLFYFFTVIGIILDDICNDCIKKLGKFTIICMRKKNITSLQSQHKTLKYRFFYSL